MSLHCKVIFPKNPLNVFYTGQAVRGYVQLSVEQEQSVSSIQIEIAGVAISKLKRNHRNKVHREDCFNHRISILAEERWMTAKIHRFPFQFKLPSELPVSFEGAYGYVRYKLTGTIESRLQPNGVFVVPITILKTISANDAELQNKISVCGKFNPYFVCKCFQWFPLQIDAHVEPGIYPPGAIIDLGINVTNKSFRRVRNFHVQLVKEVTYHSIDRLQNMKTIAILNEVELRGCNSNQKYPICLGCQLNVPETTLTDSTSILISVKYFIQITANMGRNYRPVLELPIAIVVISDS